MTRPIYEPTPARKDSYLEFWQDQLLRRPAPSGGELIQIFRAYHYLSTITRTSGGSQSLVDWDYWNFCDEEVFVPLDTALQPDPTPGVDQVRRVQLGADVNSTVPGKYDIYFGTVPDSTFTGSVELAMHDGDDTWGFPDSICHSLQSGFGGSFLLFQLDRIYPILDPIGGTNDVPQLSFTIAQVNSGGLSKDFTFFWMEIHFNPNVNMCTPQSS